MYRLQLGRRLNLQTPESFNEKLQWLKLYDRRAEFHTMVDKYAVRSLIEESIGGKYLIPLLGVWERAEDIDFDALPAQFVLKCTHDCGSVRICRGKSTLDRAETVSYFRKRLRASGFTYGREWPYKGLKPRIVAETLLKTESGDLPDYKIHCFGGKPELILVCTDRHSDGLREDWFTPAWEHLPIHRPTHENAAVMPEKPPQLAEMLRLAAKLAGSLPFLRVDFYIADGRVYFGELTFFPTSGYTAFVPEEYDRILGRLLTLPQKAGEKRS